MTKPTPYTVPFETEIVVISGFLTIPHVSLVDVGVLAERVPSPTIEILPPPLTIPGDDVVVETVGIFACGCVSSKRCTDSIAMIKI